MKAAFSQREHWSGHAIIDSLPRRKKEANGYAKEKCQENDDIGKARTRILWKYLMIGIERQNREK